MNYKSLLIAAVSCLLVGCAEDPMEFEATGSAGTGQAGSAGVGGSSATKCTVGLLYECSCNGSIGVMECNQNGELEACKCPDAGSGSGGSSVGGSSTGGAGGSSQGGTGGSSVGGSSTGGSSSGGSSTGGSSTGGSSQGGSSTGGSSTGGSGGSSGPTCSDLGGKCVTSDIPPSQSCPNGYTVKNHSCPSTDLPGGGQTCCISGGAGGSSTGGSSGQGGTSQGGSAGTPSAGGSGGSPQVYTYYVDADGDGYGTASHITSASSTPPSGYATKFGDCDDTNAARNPGLSEICDGLDNDCDTQIDEGYTKYYFHPDKDGDGYGDPNDFTAYSCKAPAGHVVNDQDCDDADQAKNPGQIEFCDLVDNNCDGQIDEGYTKFIYRQDLDGDGWGSNVTVTACMPPAGYKIQGIDCNDSNSSINPGVGDPCNGVDDNCDGQVDETCQITQDVDKDGQTAAQGDCNDNDASVKTGATEQCDGKDNDCDGLIDEGCGTPSTTKLVCYFKAADNQKHDYYAYNWIASTTPTITYNSVWGKFEMIDPPEGSKLIFDTYRDPPSGNPWQYAGCQWDNPSHLNFEFACYFEKNGVKKPTPEVQGESNQQNGCREFVWVQASGATDWDGDGFASPHDCNDNGPFVHPGADDPYGGPDENCNGSNNF